MNRYENGKIYKIVDVGYNKCYIGSTCESLSRRMAKHRHQYNSYLKGKHGKTRSFLLFDEFGIENCKIELIEQCPCNNKEELRQKEGHYIKNTDCVNRQTAGRSKEEYRHENKEKLADINKKYRENNKEQLKIKKEEKQDYYTNYNKIWKEENKEHISEYNKKYREENKDHLAKKEVCDNCGSLIRKYDMKKHKQTKKCQSSGINNSS